MQARRQERHNTMRIGINLATRPFTDIGPILKRLRIGMSILALVAIALGFGLHALHQKAEEARARQQVVENQIVSVNHERQNAEAMMRKPENAQVLDEAQNLNQLFDVKGFSWTLAMEDLETTLPGGVQVTTLEPARDKNGNITVKLRVLGPREKDIAFVQNLEHSHHFLSPRIVGESSENSDSAGQRYTQVSASNRVNFEIQADYNPPTLDELKAADAKKELGSPKATLSRSSPLQTIRHNPTRRLPRAAGAFPMTASPIHLAREAVRCLLRGCRDE
ncbi:MAG: PilN domain-containing protein [Acidobacteriota bacterium]|nr:PilN domain-containing protein [Acidobacteriota bacterium]